MSVSVKSPFLSRIHWVAKSADAVVERMLAKVFELTSVKDIPADLFEQAKTLLENQAKREKDAAKPKSKAKSDKEKLAEIEADKK